MTTKNYKKARNEIIYILAYGAIHTNGQNKLDIPQNEKHAEKRQAAKKASSKMASGNKASSAKLAARSKS